MLNRRTIVTRGPIFAAIDRHWKLSSKCDRFYVALSNAESRAKEKLGLGERPFGLIVWHTCHIGGSEIDSVRERFLE